MNAKEADVEQIWNYSLLLNFNDSDVLALQEERKE